MCVCLCVCTSFQINLLQVFSRHVKFNAFYYLRWDFSGSTEYVLVRFFVDYKFLGFFSSFVLFYVVFLVIALFLDFQSSAAIFDLIKRFSAFSIIHILLTHNHLLGLHPHPHPQLFKIPVFPTFRFYHQILKMKPSHKSSSVAILPGACASSIHPTTPPPNLRILHFNDEASQQSQCGGMHALSRVLTITGMGKISEGSQSCSHCSRGIALPQVSRVYSLKVWLPSIWHLKVFEVGILIANIE